MLQLYHIMKLFTQNLSKLRGFPVILHRDTSSKCSKCKVVVYGQKSYKMLKSSQFIKRSRKTTLTDQALCTVPDRIRVNIIDIYLIPRRWISQMKSTYVKEKLKENNMEIHIEYRLDHSLLHQIALIAHFLNLALNF